jgi:hypothetical protein
VAAPLFGDHQAKLFEVDDERACNCDDAPAGHCTEEEQMMATYADNGVCGDRTR